MPVSIQNNSGVRIRLTGASNLGIFSAAFATNEDSWLDIGETKDFDLCPDGRATYKVKTEGDKREKARLKTPGDTVDGGSRNWQVRLIQDSFVAIKGFAAAEVVGLECVLEPILQFDRTPGTIFRRNTTITTGYRAESMTASVVAQIQNKARAAANWDAFGVGVEAEASQDRRAAFQALLGVTHEETTQTDTWNIDLNQGGFYLYQSKMRIVMSDSSSVDLAGSSTVVSSTPLVKTAWSLL